MFRFINNNRYIFLISIPCLAFLGILQFSCSDNVTISPIQVIHENSSYSQQDSIIRDMYKLDSRKIFDDFGAGYKIPSFEMSCMVQQNQKSINYRQPVWSPGANYLGIFVSSDVNTKLYILIIHQGRFQVINNTLDTIRHSKKISAFMMDWGQPGSKEFLVYFSDKTLFKYKINTNNMLSCDKIYTFQKGISDLKWDGKTIYVIMSGLIYTVPENPKTPLNRLPHIPEKRTFNYCNLELHPNGKTIVYEQWNNDNSRKIWVRNDAMKRATPLINWKNSIQHSPVLSPNGQYLAFISNDADTTIQKDKKYWKIFVWDMTAGKRVQGSADYETTEVDAYILCWIDNETLMYMTNDQPQYFCFQKWNVKTASKKNIYIQKRFRFRMPKIYSNNEAPYCTCSTPVNCDGEYLKQRSGLIGYFDYSNDYMAFCAFDSSMGQYRLYIGKDFLKEVQ